MITEKQIEKTKFFTTNGVDIWKVNAVDHITAVELVNCENAENQVCVIGEETAKQFHAVTMPKVKKQVPGAGGLGTGKKKKRKGTKKIDKKRGTYKKKAKTTATAKSGRGCRPGEKPSSQYLGVTVKKAKDGKKRFYAQSARGGKYKGLGAHDIEELAAAAVQEHLGNTEEATRLRMRAKKKNPNHTIKAPATKGPEDVEHRTIFFQEAPDE